MVMIARWDLVVEKHPIDATNTTLAWKVINKIRFRNQHPEDWGEFRAYGGHWFRITNSEYDERSMLEATPKRNPGLAHNPRIREGHRQLVTDSNLPFWGTGRFPREKDGQAWHIDNDQHMEIFYADIVPGVPRSDPDSREHLADDDNEPDKPHAKDVDLHNLGRWHIIARDEPSIEPLQAGDCVEYWHRAEFQIRNPQSRVALPYRRNIFLRVYGKYPNWKYMAYIDSIPALG